MRRAEGDGALRGEDLDASFDGLASRRFDRLSRPRKQDFGGIHAANQRHTHAGGQDGIPRVHLGIKNLCRRIRAG